LAAGSPDRVDSRLTQCLLCVSNCIRRLLLGLLLLLGCAAASSLLQVLNRLIHLAGRFRNFGS